MSGHDFSEHLVGQGRVILAATPVMQFAFEAEKVSGEAQHSIFTRALVEGLQTGDADLNGDGRVSIDELFHYVSKRLAEQEPRQTPEMFGLDRAGEIVIASSPRQRSNIAQLPPELSENLNHASLSVRVRALRKLDSLLRGEDMDVAIAKRALLLLSSDTQLGNAAAKILAGYEELEHLEEAALRHGPRERVAAKRIQRAGTKSSPVELQNAQESPAGGQVATGTHPRISSLEPETVKQEAPARAALQMIRVVVASPSDVQSERDIVAAVARELNQGVAADRSLHVETCRWETDAHPGFHVRGPQGLIDPILNIEDCDVLIGIFWKRFGTPTSDAESGTQHELRHAYQCWREKGRPEIMIYFNQKPYTPKSKDEAAQWSQVLELRENFPSEGLWWPYKGKLNFEKLVRQHLTQFIRNKSPYLSGPLATK